jgi:hypothetical protein
MCQNENRSWKESRTLPLDDEKESKAPENKSFKSSVKNIKEKGSFSCKEQKLLAQTE